MHDSHNGVEGGLEIITVDAAGEGGISDVQVIVAALLTIGVGVWIDTRGYWFCQPIVNVISWAVLLYMLARTSAEESVELIWCLVIAAIGECFLGFVWGLYEYRLGNLPFFIPAGHALAFAAGKRLRKLMPPLLPVLLMLLLGGIAALGIWKRWGTQALLWYPLTVAYLWRSRDRAFYSSIFMLALTVETYGTWMGGWSYKSREPWFGLTSLGWPPVWAGTFYCTLGALVLMASRAQRNFRIKRGNG